MKTERLTSRELWVAWSVLSARQLRTVKWSTVDDFNNGMRAGYANAASNKVDLHDATHEYTTRHATQKSRKRSR